MCADQATPIKRSVAEVTTAPPPDAITGPAWNLQDEYPALNSPELESDLARATESIDTMRKLGEDVIADHLKHASVMNKSEAEALGIITALEKMHDMMWETSTLLGNVATYASCIASVDSANALAKKMLARIDEIYAKLEQSYTAASLFLKLCTDEVVNAFLALSDSTKASAFRISHSRKMKDHTLPLAEENMLAAYQVPGIYAWGTLYDDLSGSLKVDLKEFGGVMGIATAAGKLDDPKEEVRERSWRAINGVWKQHYETCAAILNALTAWRAETNTRRRIDHYLVPTLHRHKMKRASLDAMLTAIADRGVEVGQRALRIQAAALGKSVLAPWDLMAPAPVREGAPPPTLYPFEDGIKLVAEAAGAVDPDIGEFVYLMKERKYIEATRGDKKRPGAYMTEFPKSRMPRVYLSEYNGRAQLVSTLAHELGHAWHGWAMRDIPPQRTGVPMNLAETASIFLETAVAAELAGRAKTPEERFAIEWNNAADAIVFLCNLPARFEFESKLNERRKEGKLTPEEMDAMMVDAWRKYYGDALGSIDEVGPFFASKLHFYISSLSFYNHSYTFGYLFALGVFSKRQGDGDTSFAKLYRALLRDTGSMTSEDVVRTHLGGNIEEVQFWIDAIGVVEKQVDAFEKTAKQLGYL